HRRHRRRSARTPSCPNPIAPNRFRHDRAGEARPRRRGSASGAAVHPFIAYIHPFIAYSKARAVGCARGLPVAPQALGILGSPGQSCSSLPGGMDDGLRLEEFSEGYLAPFASIARLLVAAEGGLRVFAGTVDEDDSGFEPCRDRKGL